MKMHDKCLPCIINQVIKTSDIVGITEKEDLLRKVFVYLSKMSFDQRTPETIGDIFEMIKEYSGNPDPYKSTRDYYNSLFLKIIPRCEDDMNQSENPFQTAVKYAIIGNIIDFNPIHNTMLEDIEKQFDNVNQLELSIDDTQKLEGDIQNAKQVLYLGDNCGEICLDKILLKKMKELNPDIEIKFAVRGKPVVNDSIAEDAYFVGIDQYAEIVDNGDGSLGTVLHRTSEEFQKIYAEADVIIAKGQANYECLSEEKRNIYFLLMTKCNVIADAIGTDSGKMVCKSSMK